MLRRSITTVLLLNTQRDRHLAFHGWTQSRGESRCLGLGTGNTAYGPSDARARSCRLHATLLCSGERLGIGACPRRATMALANSIQGVDSVRKPSISSPPCPANSSDLRMESRHERPRRWPTCGVIRTALGPLSTLSAFGTLASSSDRGS